MYSLNKAQVIGNLTRDPELKQIPSGQSVCTFGVATNRRWKTQSGEMQEAVEFHNIVCWGKVAELAEQFLKKGSKVFIEGRLQTRNWEDDAGIKHYRTEIVAQDIIFLSNKGTGQGTEAQSPAVAKAEAPTEEPVAPEDLPF